MLDQTINILNIRHLHFHQDVKRLKNIGEDDICFYRFIGGNSSETEDMIRHLDLLRVKRGLLIGIFRFPFRFEGKKRKEIAIKQYYWMKEMCDSIIFFHGDGMLEVVDTSTYLVDATELFNVFEEKAIHSLKEMICNTGDMNIDAQDVRSFIQQSKDNPLFLHTVESESFDEPLKNLISAPYLPDNYTDGKQLIINIGYTREVNMDAFRNINLRLHDMFHKSDLVKLGTYFINEPGHRFKITILVNGISDPYPKPADFKSVQTSTLRLKRKWELAIKKGKNMKFFSNE